MANPFPRVPLDESAAPADPYVLFERWYDDAVVAGLALPNAMTLATVGVEGHPAARMVLLKGVEDGSFVFYTNYESRKGRELTARPYAALVFHWAPLERQVRIEGRAERMSTDESREYYRSRPLGSRIGAWASFQSSELATRDELEARFRSLERELGADPPLPPHWGGFVIAPSSIEFWQGRPNRLHDRLEYLRMPQGWRLRRLSP